MSASAWGRTPHRSDADRLASSLAEEPPQTGSLFLGGGYFAGVTESPASGGRADVENAVGLLGGGAADVLRGIALIDEAARRGDAEALERRALFEAVGCNRPQDWHGALDCLALGAANGSGSAGKQLRILARTAGGSDWSTIRSRISIEGLLRSPPNEVLSEAPRLRVVRQFATPEECQWLVERAKHRLRPATVVTQSGSQTVRPGRSNSAIEFQLADMDVVVEVLRARISAATRLPLPIFETSQVLHYSPGQSFKPHHDYFDPENPAHAKHLKAGQRIGTFLIYLNDAYTLGETAFPRANLSFRGGTGDALFISNVERNGRPDPMTFHAGTPPGSGEKWLFSQWIRDRTPTATAS